MSDNKLEGMTLEELMALDDKKVTVEVTLTQAASIAGVFFKAYERALNKNMAQAWTEHKLEIARIFNNVCIDNGYDHFEEEHFTKPNK